MNVSLMKHDTQNQENSYLHTYGAKSGFGQVGTPTYAYDLAENIYNIIVKRQFDKTGIYHYTNEGVCGRYDFALKIAEMVGNVSCKISHCLSYEFPAPVTRPSYSILDKAKIKETFDIKIPY